MMSIKAIRLQMGLSQAQFAEKCGVSREQICRYETGKLVPDLKTLIKIKNGIGITLDELVEEEIQDGA